ncbi:hypothetical protein KUCAC02_011715, partial [Chaenocephalus aceratus]
QQPPQSAGRKCILTNPGARAKKNKGHHYRDIVIERRAGVWAPGQAEAETMVAARDRAEGDAVSQRGCGRRGEARGLQPGSGRVSEETWGVNMAELKAKPNTCGDMALPRVM